LLRDPARFRVEQGLWTDSRRVETGVTEQFLDNADVYHERYFARTDFDEMLRLALDQTSVERQEALAVLDLGSGGGSSVFALCRLLPQAHILATDISRQLLRLLLRIRDGHSDLQQRVGAVCMDIHQPVFQESAFDLVIGAAILHHLVDPLAALKHVVGSMKPGAQMVLIEPLEAGSAVLTALFDRVDSLFYRDGQPDHPIALFCRAMRRDIHARFGPEHLKPWTAHLDDKWVFGERYLLGLAQELGCRDVRVVCAQADVTHIYAQGFYSTVADAGLDKAAIPPAIHAEIDRFDADFSNDFKRRCPPTGLIVFER
jgi:2-polyprenyl-3-methyl-5-hydroxy-6-metoxy-1,4-benzoquinol methylase